ncbi:MAG: acyl-CoA desaturase [Intrasporangium sp.]|uniref:fatty acid desaturase family protein n=1 Tax=Intrasporangium sp. TaxID=1925024 RepID=UPI002647F94C|nr:acyl-CoA desaturase [Intrasporangium sp.]MDN5795326.1 acyl-CoA desaturase [Intrasporangium sp.]
MRDSHLLERRYGWYWSRILGTLVAFAAVWVAVAIVGDSWWQLVIAGAFAVISAQIGFLGHDAAHRQIFRSRQWNEWTSRVLSGLVLGLSYGWWDKKHSRHHAAQNQEGIDPDIESRVLAFTPELARTRHGMGAAFARRQGWLFFPLLTLEGLNLQLQSVLTVASRRPLKQRWVEAVLIGVRLTAYPVALLLLLPPSKAAAFFGLQAALFGVCLGGSFAPNHKGMPLVPPSLKVDFLRRQVLMSRNVTGGPLVDFAMGGLNLQIEHHLFPSVPRPNLRRLQPLVRAHCIEHNVTYTEKTLWQSYGMVVRYLNAVGIGARDPFSCPLVRRYRG